MKRMVLPKIQQFPNLPHEYPIIQWSLIQILKMSDNIQNNTMSQEMQQLPSFQEDNQQQFSRKQPQIDHRITSFYVLALFLVFCISYYMSTEVQHLELYKQTLHKQIGVKRKNQNSLSKLMTKPFIEYEEDNHRFRQQHNDLLIDFYRKHNAKSVADFGCGRCEYILNVAKALQIEIVGYDSSPFADDARIQAQDLSSQMNLGRKFDFVQSFQVGEHIFSDQEDIFISNLVKHAEKGILLSWGVYGQRGFYHVNNRPLEYVIEKVESYGFVYSKEESEKWRQKFFKGFAIYYRK